jgi:hypothetical protein
MCFLGATSAADKRYSLGVMHMPTLYHYCDTTAFLSIVERKEIWLSSLVSSNDETEGQLLADALLRISETDGTDAHTTEMLTRALVFVETLNNALGFCMSEDADVLSQWRAYGDGGQGVAIGFDLNALRSLVSSDELPITLALHQVEYQQVAHEAAVRPLYQQLSELIAAGALTDADLAELLGAETTSVPEAAPTASRSAARLLMTLLSHADTYFRLKHEGFSEEKEWRLLSNQFHGISEECRFRARGSRVVAYRPFSIPNVSDLITEVVAGPRHSTHLSLLSSVLRQAGLLKTPVRASTIPYRS